MYDLEKLTKWQLWFHYIPLTGVIFIAHHFSGFLEEMVVAGQTIAWVYLFIWYTVWVAIGDQIIHFLLSFTGWED